MANQDDQIWIRQVLNGDNQPFKNLVDKYQRLVFAIALKILEKKEDAEDAAQEIFVKCYKGLSGFNQQSSFSTWLYRIAYNHSLDMAKKSGALKNVVEWKNTEHAGSLAENNPAGSELDYKTIQSVLKDALNTLPPDHRILIHLYYFEELPLKEIAQIQGINANNLKIQLHRIRAKLMEQLKSRSEIISILNL